MIALISNNRNVRSTTLPVHYLNLSAFLTEHGIDNEIIEIKEPSRFRLKSIDYYDSLLIDKIRKGKFRYVGLSSYTTDYNYTIALIRKIKNVFPDIKILMGGIHVTLRPQDPFLSKAPVDYIIYGEGEFTLLELLKADKPIEEIHGIGFLKGGEFVLNEPRALSKDLTHLPLPAYGKIDMEFYLKPNNMGIRFLTTSCAHIFTGLGCPFNCSFCANSNLYKSQSSKKIVRYKSIAQVFNEINLLKENYGLESFYIQDDTFSFDKRRVYDICEMLIKENVDLLWGAETRTNLIDEQTIIQMKKAGCCQLDFGVEAATQQALDRMKKGITIEDVYSAFYICRKHGVRTGANLMLNTPGETEEDVCNMESVIKKLKANVYYIALTVPFIGTDIYEEFVYPKLSIDEYVLFQNAYLFGSIIDKRFRLAKHDLPLEKIIMKLRLKFMIPKIILDIPLKVYYLRYFYRSKYKLEILKEIFINLTSSFSEGLRFILINILKSLRSNKKANVCK